MSKSEQVTNDLGEATTCDCGGFNLTIGPMTVHFEADEALQLRELIGLAVAQLVRKTEADAAETNEPSRSDGTLH